MIVIWTVYDRPLDYPDEFVARKWVVHGIGSQPYGVKANVEHTEETVIRRPTLDALRAALPAGLHCIPRQPGDEPQIVETWL